MNKEDYKTAYENVMIANKMLYEENQQLKKQKDDVVEFIKEYHNYENRFKWCEQDYIDTINEIERMLGEIDE